MQHDDQNCDEVMVVTLRYPKVCFVSFAIALTLAQLEN